MESHQLSHGTIVTLVAAAALLGLYAYVVWREFLEGRWLTLARRHLHGCRANSWRLVRSELDEAVREKMQETGMANFNIVNHLFMHVFPIWCFGVALELLSKGYLLDWPVVAVELAGAALTFLLHLCPQLMGPKTLRIWQFGYFVVACVLIMPGMCSPSRLSNVSRLSSLILTASNCALLHIPTAVAQHSVYFAAVRFAIAKSPLHVEDRTLHVGMEIIAAIVSCSCVAVMQRLVEAHHRSNLQATCLTEKQLANNKLMSVFYEVVVEVDSELTIVSSDPDLGLFLPHGAGCPIPTLLGTKLDELLPDEQDRQLLAQHTRQTPVGEESSVDVLHLKMCHGGSESDGLNVELFSLRFNGLMGCPRHLIGVREFGDEGEKRDWSCMTLRVDALDQSLPIVDISPNLRCELGGAGPGTSVCHVIEDPQEFACRLEEAVNTVASDDGLEPSDSFKVVLRPLGQCTRILADCCVTVDAGRESEPGVKYAARLSFSNLSQLHQGSLHSRSSSSIGSRSSRNSRNSRSSRWRHGTPRELQRQPLVPPLQAARLGSPLSL